MSVLRRIWVIGCLLLGVSAIRAQNPLPFKNNLRSQTFAVQSDTLRIDTVSIIPQTLRIVGVDAGTYQLNEAGAYLVWIVRPATDSVQINWRSFGFRLQPVTQRMSFDSISNNMSLVPYEFNNDLNDAQKGIFNFGNIQAQGSFGRQIGFGNSQDAVLNSTLNLQLSGMLGDSIEIMAAITDNNIPIQPDGTTQQLNEFDQVFLQFKKKNWQLNLGDIDLRQNQSYFLNFYKRLQGVSFQTTNQIGTRNQSKTLASGSIAKGKFTRNVFQGLEGNQGPYRLTGANNEAFFIVLANTERVFLDGQLLQRGEDQDYVINYNTAEVTFTPRRMITKDSRIQVEFEYADRNFLNANFYLSQELKFGDRLQLRIGAFNNSDARNSQINQVLDDPQKQFLAALGDSVQRAFYPSAVPDTFAASKVLYEKVYFSSGAGVDSFYRYSTDPDLAKYSVSFTQVGAGNGNYVSDFNAANGKVYRYVDPIAGIKQGDFEPITILVTPKTQQVVNLGMDYQINKNSLLKAEVAMSNYDANTFSKVDNGDDKGFAGKFQWNQTMALNAAKGLELLTSADYEFVKKKFRPLERLRSVEFTRDWGLPIVVTPQDENIVRAAAGLRSKKNHQFNYRFTHYTRGSDYKGAQQAITHTADWKGWQFNNELVVTRYNSSLLSGTFLRPTIDLNKQLRDWRNWRIGFRYALEGNTVRDKNTDTISPAGFYFDTYSLYLRSDEAKQNRVGITFFTRMDKYQYGKSFLKGDRSYNLNLQTELLANPNRQLTLNATFRKLHIINPLVSQQDADESILGRAEYSMSEWKGFLTGNMLYEVGAGQEQRRDLSYLEVPAGTGVYAWIDYNNDGVQQLNEFELAAFPDQARFIRILTPTNEFIKANYVTLNYSFGVNPRLLWDQSKANGLQRWLGRFNYSTSLQTSRKAISAGSFEFNPFGYSLNDTALITLNTIMAHTLSFNRFSTRWGIDGTILRNNGKSLLTYGYESRELRDLTLKLRVNFSRSLTFNLNGRRANNSLFTPNSQFDNRNYDLDINSIEPILTLIRGTAFRMSLGYKLEDKQNLEIYGGESSKSHAFNLETKYNVLQNSSITGKFTYNSIRFNAANGSATTTVSYTMLDGLLPGQNLLWNLTLTKRLLNNLELNFQYDGRKPASARTVHTGRAAITALF
ncbi:MAG: hypothetical protein ACK4E0_04370 [Chitinophagaceae bacterium]